MRLSCPSRIPLAQEYRKVLHSPATVQGFIGGESHDSYVVHARKSRIITTQVSWRHEHDNEMGDNHAEFFVSGTPVFCDDGAIRGAKESNDGTHSLRVTTLPR